MANLADEVKIVKASGIGLGGWCRGPDKTVVPADDMGRWDRTKHETSTFDARVYHYDKTLDTGMEVKSLALPLELGARHDI